MLVLDRRAFLMLVTQRSSYRKKKPIHFHKITEKINIKKHEKIVRYTSIDRQ